LRHPLGELAIVVVGVLIALAADRWNEVRVQRGTAEDYLARLEADLAVDLVEYREAARAAVQIDSAALYVLGVHRGQPVPESEHQRFVRAVLTASWAPRPTGTRDTYEELVSTGNLSFLSSAIRRKIKSYYNLVDLYNRREDSMANQLEARYWSVPSKVLGANILPMAWEVQAGRSPGYDPTPEEFAVDADQVTGVVTRLRAMPEVEAHLAQVRHFHVQRKAFYADRLPSAAEALKETLSNR
jgi:hypothetical protein